MAVVGKVMPRPRGFYDGSAVYDIIDGVSHNNNLWLCKRPNTVGIEPSKENEDYWFLAIEGQFSNAGTLDGHDSSYFAVASEIVPNKDKIVTFKPSVPGWYRIAEYDFNPLSDEVNPVPWEPQDEENVEVIPWASLSNSVELKIKRSSTIEIDSEYHYVLFDSKGLNSAFRPVINHADQQGFTTIRYVIDGENHIAYIDLYYNLEIEHEVYIQLSDGKDSLSHWKTIEVPVPVLSNIVEPEIMVVETTIPQHSFLISNLDLPTKVSEFENDAGYAVRTDMEEALEKVSSDLAELSADLAELSADIENNSAMSANISANISDAYDNTATYVVGDYRIHDNTLYVCNTDIPEAEEFNAEHWTVTNITYEMKTATESIRASLGTQVTYSLSGTTLNITTK